MTRECFICYTKDGKSEKDRLLDEKHYVKCTNYPIIPLSRAYSCKCETTFAHNRCLQTIEKCPTCRFKTKPNLHVDLYFEKYLSWIYSKPDNIKIVENYIISYFAIIFALANLINEEFINANIYLSGFLLISLILILLSSYMFDSIKKYWLYDEESHRFYGK